LIAPLPPKRISLNGKHVAVDNHFLERRRRGLQRYSEAIINHPVFKVESLVQAFFAEASIEAMKAAKPINQEADETILSSAEEAAVRVFYYRCSRWT